MNHEQIAHAWAHKTKTSSNNRNQNVFFDGPTIYSFGRHFAIASHVTSPRTGGPLVMFTSESYSTSTGKHKRIVARAIPAGVQVLNTGRPGHYAGGYAGDLETALNGDIKAAAAEVNKLLGKAARASKNRPYILGDAARVHDNALQLVHHFGKGQDRRRLRAMLPAIPDADKIGEYLQARADRDRKTAAAAAAKARRKHAKELKAWRAGAGVSLSFDPGGDLLRLSACGNFLETSRACKAPVSDCRAVLSFALRMQGQARDVRPAGVALGVYTLNSIGPAGAVVGCHNFSWSEILHAAALVNAD